MKNMTLRTVFVAGALLLVIGCAPATPSSSDSPTGGAPAAQGSRETDIGKMTDDVYVELAAQEMYHDGIDPEAWGASGGGRDRLYARYGVTAEQASAFAESVGKNGGFDRAMALTERVDKRLKELQAGGK